jgi:hypothetical protein
MILFYPILFLVILYSSIWVYLLYGSLKEQRRAIQTFMTAWENDLYETREAKQNFTAVLRISFPCDQGVRYIDVDEDGTLLSGIRWADSGRGEMLPKRRLKRKLEQYTQQIATMYKLEHGGFDEQDNSVF